MRPLRALTSPWAWLVVVVGGLVVAWLARDLITPYGPADVRADRIMLPIASAGSPLGTDNFGRDMVSRLLAGVPVSVAAGIVPATASMALGTVIGLVSGYVGGRVDRVLMSLMDVLLAFPFILLALLAVAILGSSFINAMIAVTIAILPASLTARITAGTLDELRHEDFVRTVLAAGIPMRRIALRHVLPNAMLPVITNAGVLVGSMFTSAVFVEAVFGWPGVGTMMISAVQGRDYPTVQAGAFVVASVFVIVNWTVDALYSLVDPRIKG